MTGAVNDAFWDFGPYRFDGPAPSWDSGFVVPPVYRFETIRQGPPADWLHPRRTAAPKKQKSKPKESKLTPEDTKELDDFLNSFVVKPAT